MSILIQNVNAYFLIIFVNPNILSRDWIFWLSDDNWIKHVVIGIQIFYVIYIL